jgi:hypothetical protein
VARRPCREEYDKLQAGLQATGGRLPGAGAEGPALHHAASAEPGPNLAEADTLASQQLTAQMEALLGEKSKLAQDNARLLRENTGLQVRHKHEPPHRCHGRPAAWSRPRRGSHPCAQELLEFSLMHQAELVGDDVLFDEDVADGGAWPAVDAMTGGEGSFPGTGRVALWSSKPHQCRGAACGRPPPDLLRSTGPLAAEEYALAATLKPEQGASAVGNQS